MVQESEKNQSALVEFIYNDNTAETTHEKIQLVRILSRSSTLPKVQNINIQPFASNPDGFFIQAGKGIKIGANILANPVVALIYIRYGLEWQIWYKSQEAEEADPRICDIAACQVTARFYDTIPKSDKQSLSNIPENFFYIFRKFNSVNRLPELTKSEFQLLGEMNNAHYSSRALDPAHQQILCNLAYPLEYLLMKGGDKRLQIDPDRLLNKYGCRPFPRPKAFTFASSTATSISNIAFNQAEKKREALIHECFKQGVTPALSSFGNSVKDKLRKILFLPKSASLILAPSGTDISLLFAGLCQTLFDRPIVHILVACDETGSGVPLALRGNHFSDRSSQGFEVTKGKPVDAFKKTEHIDIALRSKDGMLKNSPDLDLEVEQAVEATINKGKQPVLHVMNQSKLGYAAPSENCLKRLEAKFGQGVLSLIDNSQLRMNRKKIGDYLNRNYAMTVTGSKFFTGPPFNGALIIPHKWEELLKNSKKDIPTGLKQYLYKTDFPEAWHSVKKLETGTNIGTMMRWYASLIEIERYFETPVSLRNLGREMFCNHVKLSIERSAFLQALSKDEQTANRSFKTNERRTIFPFFMLKNGMVLPHEKVDRVYKLLNRDLSETFPHELENIGLLGKQACHIGQPVKTIYRDGTATGVVRISLGSRVISESWKEQDVSLFFQKIEEQMNQVDIIIRKIKLILNHSEWLENDLNK